MAETRIYTIPLRREFQKTSYKRKTNKAVKALKEFVVKHLKVDKVLIGEELNESLWARGITNPPAKVKVEIVKDVVKKDNVETSEAFVNLIGIKRKVVETSKKGILNKEKSGLKDKLADAVETLKGGADKDSAEEKPEAETKPKKKVKVVVKDDKAETKTEAKPATKKKVVIKE